MEQVGFWQNFSGEPAQYQPSGQFAAPLQRIWQDWLMGSQTSCSITGT
jgi:hypothetical protein